MIFTAIVERNKSRLLCVLAEFTHTHTGNAHAHARADVRGNPGDSVRVRPLILPCFDRQVSVLLVARMHRAVPVQSGILPTNKTDVKKGQHRKALRPRQVHANIDHTFGQQVEAIVRTKITPDASEHHNAYPARLAAQGTPTRSSFWTWTK